MAYTDKEIYDESIEIIEEDHNVCFLSDLFTKSSFSKPTFYEHVKKDSNEFNYIKKALALNKNKTKQLLRQKWFESKQPTLQLALYKLLSNRSEFERIASNNIDIKTNGQSLNDSVDLSKASTATLTQLLKELNENKPESDKD
jgi:hypothetical protein